MSENKKISALQALTMSALVLPGYAGKAQAWSDPDNQSAFRFSYYKEAALPASATNGLPGDRYSVYSNQFHLLHPAGEAWDYGADLAIETMSGASPWYIVPGADGKPIQVMSGATIQDHRIALDAKGDHYTRDGKQSVSLGVSSEQDYFSVSGGAEAQWDFDEQRRTLALGIGYSHDQLKPTDGGSLRFPTRVASANKNSGDLSATFSQVLTPDTVVQVSAHFSLASGFLSDPYKEAYVAAALVPDARPRTRRSLALMVRLRQYYASLRGALHVDFRRYDDDWEVGSDTVDLSWHQSLGHGWDLSPALRYYEQGAAGFYRPYYNAARSDGYYSSDYRLSPYGAISARLDLSKTWKDLSFALSYERYDSSGRYAPKRVDVENPGLVDFGVASLALGYKF